MPQKNKISLSGVVFLLSPTKITFVFVVFPCFSRFCGNFSGLLKWIKLKTTHWKTQKPNPRRRKNLNLCQEIWAEIEEQKNWWIRKKKVKSEKGKKSPALQTLLNISLLLSWHLFSKIVLILGMSFSKIYVV